jgi:hypothetical protein
MRHITYWIVTCIISCIAYGLGNEFGPWYADQLKSTGGFIDAQDLLRLQALGPWFAIIVLILSAYIYFSFYIKETE